MDRATGGGKRPHMLHIFSFQGWRGGDVEQSGFVKSASGRRARRGSTLTTVGGGHTLEHIGFLLLLASFSKLNQQ